MSKFKILIIDDSDIELIKDRFINSTFLKYSSEIYSTTTLFKKNELEQNDSAESILSKETFDLIFLDLEFAPEGIYNDEPIVLNFIQKVISPNSRLIILSKSGIRLKSPYYQFRDCENEPMYPLVAKDIKLSIWKTILITEIKQWNRKLFLSLSYKEYDLIRSNITTTKTLTINNRKYELYALFGHLSDSKNLDINYVKNYLISLLKINEIKNWEEITVQSIKYELPLKQYYIELYTNSRWYEDIKHHESFLLFDIISAIFYLKYSSKSSTDKSKYSAILQLSNLKWECATKKLSKDINDVLVILEFLNRLSTRRVILYLYLLLDIHPDDIYYILNYRFLSYRKDDELDTKTVANPIRYCFFIEGLSFENNIDKRRKRYTKVYRNNLLVDDFRIFISISNKLVAFANDLSLEIPQTFLERKFYLERLYNNYNPK